jgi:hypothetical protein
MSQNYIKHQKTYILIFVFWKIEANIAVSELRN